VRKKKGGKEERERKDEQAKRANGAARLLFRGL
jgi:hypothetical protein